MRISDWSSDVCSSDLLFQWAQAKASGTSGGIRVAMCRSIVWLGASSSGRAMVPGVFGGSRSHSDRRAEAGAGFCSVGKVAGVPAGTTIMAYSTHGASGQSVLTVAMRSEEHTSELQSLMRNSYAVFCFNKK